MAISVAERPTAALALAPPVRLRAALATLARRRAKLTAANPRQIGVPLLTPILFAVVIAPALKQALGGLHNGVDYTAFVAIGTVGLLVPFTAVFAGLSVITDRQAGAQRELLAAPIPRPMLVIGNLLVALVLAALQVGVLIGVAALRGATFHLSVSGWAWFISAALLFAVFMYGVAEALASRIAKQEEYIALTPAVAVLPWFFAGSLFPIGALPGALTTITKFLPLTHAMALMRYGLADPSGRGLHDIWGMSSTTTEAFLSLAVVAAFAVVFTLLAIRLFARAATR